MSSYGEHGKWREARKPFRCEYWLGAAGRCRTVIRAGDLYFDTGEGSGNGGGFATDRICAACVDRVNAEVRA